MTGIPGKLNLAVPDGHLMVHAMPFITNAGLKLLGYEKANLNRRPELNLLTKKARDLIKRSDLIATKVIRPQDMPTHVANGNFDLALSGSDWFTEHKLRFPSSPIGIRLPLGLGRVRIVAAVHQDNPDSITEYIGAFRLKYRKSYFKIATEYVYIANDYAQRHNLNPYKIIMTYGATESMIPEDCEMIVENTETGNTLRKNNLKEIEIIMESEGCLIVNQKSLEDSTELAPGVSKSSLIEGIATLLDDQLKIIQ